jgi:hypothetical protein
MPVQDSPHIPAREISADSSGTRPQISARLEPLAVSEIEAGRLLGLSSRTVFSLRKAGKLKAVKIGEGAKSRVIYSVEELRRFIASTN